MPPEPAGGHEVDRILKHLEQTLGERRFRHWFQGKTRLRIEGDLLRVDAASPYLLNWIQRQFGDALAAAAHAAVHPGLRVQYEVDATLTMSPARGELEEAVALPMTTSVSRTTQPERSATDGGPAGLVSRRRQADLRDFVVGDCNRMAHAAAVQVTESPGHLYSPLFLYASVGNGKTHLLEGIARQIKRRYPALQVLHLSAENFTNYFTRALNERSLPAFRQRFRGCDVLLVDDVDFLEGKKGIQEEFLHTLQQLESSGRQIVLTADRHPKLLTRLSDELITRFLSGLVGRIDAPDLATRQQILTVLARKRNCDVSETALQFVATRFTKNVRELVGAMNCLTVWQSLHQRRVSKTVARQVLASLERDCLRIVRLDDIESAVCRLFGVTSRDLKSLSRARHVSQPRMLAMHLARRLTSSACSEIGRYFGGRNHSTVLSADRKVGRLIEENQTLKIASEEWSIRDVVQILEQQILAG